MKIGIIGPSDSCDKIENVIKKYFKKIIPVKYSVSKIEDAYIETDKAKQKCKALIFSGIGVYSKAKEKIALDLPYVYIPHLAASIIKPLWELKELYPKCKNITIDSISDVEDVYEIIDEFGLKDIKIKIKEYNSQENEIDYLKFHKDALDKSPENVAIAGLGWVYEELKKQGYKALRLYPINSTIKYTVNELLIKMDAKNAELSKIAVQIIKIKNDTITDQYRDMEIKSLLEGELVEYLKEIQGSITSSSVEQYTIYSTAGALTNNENTILLRKKIGNLDKKRIKIAIGNGYGKTAYESEINARKALKQALNEQESAIYEVDNEKIRGPLFSYDELEYEYTADNDGIKKIADKLKINLLYLKKIEAITRKFEKKLFTSEELATYLGISIRSVNRLIKKIIDGGYGKRKISKATNTVGRPKDIIEINL